MASVGLEMFQAPLFLFRTQDEAKAESRRLVIPLNQCASWHTINFRGRDNDAVFVDCASMAGGKIIDQIYEGCWQLSIGKPNFCLALIQ